MDKASKSSPKVRERAVHLVREHCVENPSLWAAMESIGPKIGCVPQTWRACWASDSFNNYSSNRSLT